MPSDYVPLPFDGQWLGPGLLGSYVLQSVDGQALPAQISAVFDSTYLVVQVQEFDFTSDSTIRFATSYAIAEIQSDGSLRYAVVECAQNWPFQYRRHGDTIYVYPIMSPGPRFPGILVREGLHLVAPYGMYTGTNFVYGPGVRVTHACPP